jgi:hypothetical protein
VFADRIPAARFRPEPIVTAVNDWPLLPRREAGPGKASVEKEPSETPLVLVHVIDEPLVVQSPLRGAPAVTSPLLLTVREANVPIDALTEARVKAPP